MGRPLGSYLQCIAELTQRGDATEESYYPALQTLLEDIANALYWSYWPGISHSVREREG